LTDIQHYRNSQGDCSVLHGTISDVDCRRHNYGLPREPPPELDELDEDELAELAPEELPPPPEECDPELPPPPPEYDEPPECDEELPPL